MSITLRDSIAAFLCLLMALLPETDANAQFPYTQTFKNTTAPGVVFGGTPAALLTAGKTISYPGGTITDPVNDGYLRLTNNSNNQRGYIYSNTPFPSSYGIKATFEYFTYGGSATGADGLIFFLFDAAVTDATFNIGGFGGSLGYAQRLNGTTQEPGVSNAYIGVGLDEYGNFPLSMEGKGSGAGGSSRIENSIVLRGKGNGFNAASTHSNYEYIRHVQTSALPGARAFSIGLGSNGVRVPVQSSAGYRKVYLELKPATVGYTISVSVTRNIGGTLITDLVIDQAAYAVAAPANLKFGIASSTGSFNNYHEIRNVNIDVYDPSPLGKPVAKNASATVCANTPAVIDVLSTATLANANQVVNKQSVRFIDNATGAKLTSLTIADKGTFSASDQPGSDGRVTFTPIAGFSGSSIIQYVFSDNFGRESTVATVLVNAVSGTPVSPVVSSITTVGPATCAGANGAIALNGLAASTVYTVNYSKDGVAANATSISSNASGILTIPNLSAGTYTNITVNDGTCPSHPLAATLSGAPVFSAAVTTNPSCNQTGTITLSGLPASVSYSLSYKYNGNTVAATSVSSNTSGNIAINNLSPGSYTELTLTQGTCVSAAQSIVMTGVNTPPAVTAAAPSSPAACGAANGQITLTGTGFSTTTGNYTIFYSKNGAALTTVTGITATATSMVIPNLDAGVYTNITVKSGSSNCVSTPLTATITDPVPPSFIIGSVVNAASCASANPTGGFTISGLTAGTSYTVTLAKNGGTPVASNYTATAGGTIALTAQTAGNYSVSVKFNGGTGCAAPAQSVAIGSATTFTVTGTGTNPTACGAADGSIQLSGFAANMAYQVSYSSNGGTVTTGTFTSNGSGNIILTSLTAGYYTISATLNCTSAPINVSLADYPTFNIVTTTAPSTCGGNNGVATITGLKAGTQYFIDYTFNGSNVNQTVTSSAAGEVVFTGVAAGTYSNITATIISGGCASLPRSLVVAAATCPAISGAVYNTPLGTAPSTGVTAGAATNLGGTLFVNLLDRTSYTVIKSASVQSNGTWSISQVPPGNYIVSLTTTATGNVAALPADYANTGEGIGTAIVAGAPTGQQFISAANDPITAINFGVNKRPTTDTKSVSVSGSSFTAAPANGFPAVAGFRAVPMSNSAFATVGFSGNDEHDCAAVKCNTGSKFSIESIAANTRIYYNFGTIASPDIRQVVPNSATASIDNFDPAKLVFYGRNGATTLNFTYTLVDKASSKSTTPATYAIAITGTPLPLTLLAYDAISTGKKAQLTWHTGSELQIERYEIARSADGKSFISIGVLDSHGRPGSHAYYELMDDQPVNGKNYYRLSAQAQDGTWTLLGTRSLTFERLSLSAGIDMYPNPADGTMIHVYPRGITSGSVKIAVIAITGEDAYQGTHDFQDNTETTIAFGRQLQPGIYIIRMTIGKAVYYQKMLVK